VRPLTSCIIITTASKSFELAAAAFPEDAFCVGETEMETELISYYMILFEIYSTECKRMLI
jgi:hypothetical protein